MNNLILKLSIASLLFFASKPCNGQVIYIPDDNFEQKLIDLGYDNELNDLVLQSTISSIQSLDISWNGIDETQKINDITGIEAFLNLKTLIADNNNINIDFDSSSLSELEYLSLKNNAISNLNVQQNTKLKYLDIGGNKFYDRDDYTTQWLCESTDTSNSFSFDLSRNHLLETLIFNNYSRQNEDGFSYINVLIDGLTNLKYIDISCETNDFVDYTIFRFFKPRYYSNNEEDFPSESCSYEDTCGETPLCTSNGLAGTDLSINQELEYFNHKNTNGYSHNISGNLNLKHYYAENYSSNESFEDLVNLETLELINLNIREIDLSANINLKNLNISGNPIEYLDLSSNPNLENVTIKGNSDNTISAELVALNLSSGANTSIVDLDITGNQNLACVIIDDNFMPPVTWITSSAAAYTSDTSCFEQEKYFSTVTLSVYRTFDLFKTYHLNSSRIFVNGLASGHGVTKRGGNYLTNIHNSGIASLNLDQYNSDVENIFFAFYRVINEANKIIYNTNPIENPQNNQDENINDAIGLAMFIRAYSYFYLVRAFGDVPIHTEYIKSFNPYSHLGPVVQEDDVYQLVESDALGAIYYLNNSINTIFPDKFAAHMLMAKYYMHKNLWYAAENHTQAIIDSGIYSLSANFNDLFTSPASNNNNESIFEVKADTYDEYSNNISYFQRNFTPFKYYGQQGFGWLYANVDLYELHRLKYPNDSRISSTYLHEYTRYDTGGPVRVYPSNPARLTFGNSFPYVLKFSRKPNSADDPNDSFNKTQNNILYRYADVLLMHAEILNEIGDTNTAINYVSQVTERAGVTLHNDYFQSQYSFREAIMREYKFELAFEGEDFFNNRRRGYQWFIDHTITTHNTQLLNENGDALYTHIGNIDVVHNDLEHIIMKFALPTAYLQALSIDEAKRNNPIIAYPNPTTGLIKFKTSEILDIEVFDLSGKKLMDDRGNQINIEKLSSATYFIKISNSERSATLKFLKQ
jgi:starch-binding outer membrane protein, SusD/RagB family